MPFPFFLATAMSLPRRARLTCLRFLAGGTLLALGGCAQFDIQSDTAARPSRVAMPTAWSAVVVPDAASATPSTEAWWRQFGDPLLDKLIDEALAAAPDLRNAQARLRQVRASRDLAVAGLYPSLGASASVQRTRSGTPSSGGETTSTRYAAGFDASWESSIFGGQRDAVAAADAEAAAAEASLDAARVSLAAEVALDYVTLRVSLRRMAIARDNAASQAETLGIAEWRARAGLTTVLDVEQARANLEQSRSAIPGLESACTEATHRLAVLLGKPPASLRERLSILHGTSPSLPRAPDAVAVGIPADTLRQRPDVRSAELALQAELARLTQREAERIPGLTLGGSLGWQSFDVASLGGGASLVRTLAASLGTVLFDGGRIRSRIAAQDAIAEQALIAYEKAVLTALEEVENALVAYTAGRQRLEARHRAAAAAGNAAVLARILYEAGAADFQKVLDSERTRLAAEDGLASAEADLLNAVIRLYKALGGGWRAATPLPAAPAHDSSAVVTDKPS